MILTSARRLFLSDPSPVPIHVIFRLYLPIMIRSSSLYTSSGSLMSISKIRRSSIGRTTRPSSSTFLTMPVDFIINTYLSFLYDSSLKIHKDFLGGFYNELSHL